MSILHEPLWEVVMQFQIDAMNCGGCARSVAKAIHSVDPQAKIDVDPTMKRVTVVSDADEDTIAASLKVAGYPVRRSALPGRAAN